MDPSFLPEKLQEKCTSLVKMDHRLHGMRALPKTVWDGGYVVALSFMSDTFKAMQKAALVKYEIGAWLVAAVCLLFIFISSWWFAVGSAIAAFAAWLIAKAIRKAYMYVGVVLLGMEVLSTDFCGWGSAYPELRKRANEILDAQGERPKPLILDHYLPRRENFSAESIRNFGPSD